MILAFFARIFNEENFVGQTHKSVTYTGIFFVLRQSGETFGDLALAVIFRLECIATAPLAVKICPYSFLFVRAKEVVQEIVHYVGTGVKVLINPEVVVVAHFVDRERKCRIEITEKAMDSIQRNLPYAEESKYMIDSVCIEIFRHLAESRFPPYKTVLAHFLPVVCR